MTYADHGVVSIQSEISGESGGQKIDSIGSGDGFWKLDGNTIETTITAFRMLSMKLNGQPADEAMRQRGEALMLDTSVQTFDLRGNTLTLESVAKTYPAVACRRA